MARFGTGLVELPWTIRRGSRLAHGPHEAHTLQSFTSMMQESICGAVIRAVILAEDACNSAALPVGGAVRTSDATVLIHKLRIGLT